MANTLDCFSMTLLWALGEVSTLVHADGYICPCGLFQEIKFANDAVVVKVQGHVRTVGVLME